MALRGAIGMTVETLLAVGQASANPGLHMWLAHALWLIANAAGLSYVPHVKASLYPLLHNPHFGTFCKVAIRPCSCIGTRMGMCLGQFLPFVITCRV